MLKLKSQKHVFWQALVVASILFIVGIIFGVALENWRANRISELYVQSELDLLDVKVLSKGFSVADLNCKEAEKENIEFADRIYEEALLLQKLEDAERITGALKMQHKKYDLLRTLLWLNSIELKQKCKSSYHTLVYLYQYDEPTWEKRAKQEVFSDFLAELKTNYGDKVILIPIAADLDLASINLLVKSYDITKLPTILIDEKVRVEEVMSVEELEKYLK